MAVIKQLLLFLLSNFFQGIEYPVLCWCAVKKLLFAYCSACLLEYILSDGVSVFVTDRVCGECSSNPITLLSLVSRLLHTRMIISVFFHLKMCTSMHCIIKLVWYRRCITTTLCLKKVYHPTTNDNFTICCPIPINFGTILLSKYAIERWFNFPPHLFSVCTLLWETLWL